MAVFALLLHAPRRLRSPNSGCTRTFRPPSRTSSSRSRTKACCRAPGDLHAAPEVVRILPTNSIDGSNAEKWTMTEERNETMGRIVARVWSDPPFKQRLLSDPGAALGELGIAVPEDMEMVVLENTPETTHLVLGAPRRVEPLSAIHDIKRFGDTYRDPRLHTLNWVSHDPVHTARIKADPRRGARPDGRRRARRHDRRRAREFLDPDPPGPAAATRRRVSWTTRRWSVWRQVTCLRRRAMRRWTGPSTTGCSSASRHRSKRGTRNERRHDCLRIRAGRLTGWPTSPGSTPPDRFRW